MLESFDFPAPDLVMPCTIGEPGDRLFLLQVIHDKVPVLFKLEKSQVAALCDYLAGILADLPPIDDQQIPEPCGSPDPQAAITSWPIGALAVAYEEGDDLLARCCERLAPDGVLIVKEIATRPRWKFLCTQPVDFTFYKGKVFFRSAEQFAALFERLGLDATFVPLHAWRPLSHVMYVCRKRG